MDQLVGSVLFSVVVVALMIGVWTWVLVLFKKGFRGLLGFDRVIVQQFENVLLYKNGGFERALTPGAYWIRIGNLQLVKIDMRSEVVRFTQGAISSDNFAMNLLCVARTQITDPKASFEGSKNYRDEIFVRLQSVVKTVCGQKTRIDIQMNHQDFNDSAKKAANLTLRDIGCECATFELLQVESTGAVTDLDNKRVGFGPH
jgi:regulator of protease activity HflC (stomatin/prohibitin superfamily)